MKKQQSAHLANIGAIAALVKKNTVIFIKKIGWRNLKSAKTMKKK